MSKKDLVFEHIIRLGQNYNIKSLSLLYNRTPHGKKLVSEFISRVNELIRSDFHYAPGRKLTGWIATELAIDRTKGKVINDAKIQRMYAISCNIMYKGDKKKQCVKNRPKGATRMEGFGARDILVGDFNKHRKRAEHSLKTKAKKSPPKITKTTKKKSPPPLPPKPEWMKSKPKTTAKPKPPYKPKRLRDRKKSTSPSKRPLRTYGSVSPPKAKHTTSYKPIPRQKSPPKRKQ